MTELPDGWRRCQLQDVAHVVLGQSPPGTSYNETGEGAAFFQGKSEFGELHPTVRKYTTAGTKFARAGDILLSVRAPVGPTNVADTDCAIGRGLAALRAKDGLDQRYLMWALRASETTLASRAAGSTFSAITGRQLSQHWINVAPPADQHRIVDVLEDHLSRLDAAATWMDAATRRCIAWEEAWLSARIGNPPSEKIVRIGDALIESRGGWSRSRKHLVSAHEGTAYLKMNNITRRGRLDLSQVVHVRADPSDLERFAVRPGDILFNSKNSGDLIGKTAVADARVDGATFNENIMRLRFDPRLQPEFVALWFLGPIMRATIIRAASASTNVAAVYRHHLVEMPIWIPAKDHQATLVAEFAQLRTASERASSEGRVVLERGTRLRSSLLEAAFSGRLNGARSDLDRVEEMAEA